MAQQVDAPPQPAAPGVGEPAAAEATPPEPAAPLPPPKDEKEYQQRQSNEFLKLKRLSKPLFEPGLFNQFKGIEKEYRDAIRKGVNRTNPKELEAMQAGLRWRTLQLSDPDIQSDIQAFTASNKNLQRDLAGAASPIFISNPKERARFREMVCQETMPLLTKLVNEGNFLARTNALQRMLDLEVVRPKSGVRTEMFAGVDDELIKVLTDPKQPDAVKAIAASSIKVYLQKAGAAERVEIALAQALAAELKRPFLSAGYMTDLLQAMEEVSAPEQVVGNKVPVVHCAMAELITDRTRDIRVRCRAARVMGRAGWNTSLNYDVISWKVADLTVETAFEYNRSRDKKDPKWSYCGYHLYLSFHHLTSAEASGNPPALPKGFLNRSPKSEKVRAAYTTALPVMMELIAGPKVTDTALRPLFGWVNKNKPANLNFNANCPPFKQLNQGGAAQPAGGQG